MLPSEQEDLSANTDDALAKRRYNALVITGMILPFLIVPFLSLIFSHKGDSYTYLFVVSRFIIWAAIGLLFIYARYGEVQKFILWGEQEHNWMFYPLWIVALFVMCMASERISYIPQNMGLKEQTEHLLRLNRLMKQYPWLGLFTAATAGITEELFFRGYLMSRLSLFFKNRHYVVLISAGLFCAMHISYRHWGEIIFTFLFGLIFGYHYYTYRNIKVLMVVHFMVDALVVVWALFRK